MCGHGLLERQLHFSVPFAGDIVSALGLWHKQATKSSYKKYRFAVFLRCLRTVVVFAHAKEMIPGLQPH